MTQEEKQFIIKALQTGIPAIAKEHIEALEEVDRISNAKQEDLNGEEKFTLLNQEIYDVTLKTVYASAPYMAKEYASAYFTAVCACKEKFEENRKAREAKEAAEKPEEDPVADKKKKSA